MMNWFAWRRIHIFNVLDPDDEHGVYYTAPCADSDEDGPEPIDSSEENEDGDDRDDEDTEGGEEMDQRSPVSKTNLVFCTSKMSTWMVGVVT